MYCVYCGAPIPDDADECGQCGRSTTIDQETQTAFPAPGVDASVQQETATPPSISACHVCGTVLGESDDECPRCLTPRGMRVDPQAPYPGAYVAASNTAEANTSGMCGTVPTSLQFGFNWGAFMLPFFWGLTHRAYVTLIVFGLFIIEVALNMGQIVAAYNRNMVTIHLVAGITALLQVVGIGCCVWFGLNGNAWAWQHRRFESVAHCRQVQHVWMVWSVVLFVLWVPPFLVNFVLNLMTFAK